jgi:hypothetical protein
VASLDRGRRNVQRNGPRYSNSAAGKNYQKEMVAFGVIAGNSVLYIYAQ